MFGGIPRTGKGKEINEAVGHVPICTTGIKHIPFITESNKISISETHKEYI